MKTFPKYSIVILFAVIMVVSISSINRSFSPPSNTINYQIETGEYAIREDAEGFHRIDMQTSGYGAINSPGDPALPQRIIELRVPRNIDWSSVRLFIETQDTQILAGFYNLAPAPPLGTVGNKLDLERENEYYWGLGKSIVNGKNTFVFNQNANFPEHAIEMLSHTEKKSTRRIGIQKCRVCAPCIQTFPV